MPDLAVAFSCAVVPRREAVHVCPVGELDLSTIPEVDARLGELHRAGFEQIALDARGLTFVDSGAVRLMLHWSRRASEEGFDFTVVGGEGVVQRVVGLTGAESHLQFREDG